MKFRTWFANCRNVVVRVLTTSDVKTTLRNYLAATFAVGFAIGALLATLWAAFALFAAILIGAALGYAGRSYVSHRRREAFRRRHEDNWNTPTTG